MFAIVWRLALFAFVGLAVIWVVLTLISLLFGVLVSVTGALLLLFPYAFVALVVFMIWYYASGKSSEQGAAVHRSEQGQSKGRIIDQE